MRSAQHRQGYSTTKDLTEGPLLKNIILFTLPIIATELLQLLFNAADIVVVGNYASETALAAVGSTGALINLIINLIMGLCVGAGVYVAKYFGSKDEQGVHEVVHTSMLTAIIGGIIFGLFGFFFAKIFLGWMDTPANVIEQASLYVKIYFVGVPFIVVYNFGASILRSVGDTKNPLIFLIIAGVINVILNLIFVIFLHMDVAGVAWATVISQVVSCILVVIHLSRVDDCHKFEFKKLKIYKDKFKEILLVGIPAGVQGSMFSISNVIIQSSINSFGDIVMSGNAAAANIEGFVYIGMNSFHQTALTFVGQHIGAKKEGKIKSIALLCSACVLIIGLVLGIGAYLLGEPLLSLYAEGENEALVIQYGLKRMAIISTTYCICGIMDVFSGLLRGINKSISSMIISLLGVCGIRILWIYTVFKANRDLTVLYLSYPISWLISIAAQITLFVIAYALLMKRARARDEIEKKGDESIEVA